DAVAGGLGDHAHRQREAAFGRAPGRLCCRHRSQSLRFSITTYCTPRQAIQRIIGDMSRPPMFGSIRRIGRSNGSVRALKPCHKERVNWLYGLRTLKAMSQLNMTEAMITHM